MAKKEFTVEQVVVVKCKPLMDGWECDCDRTPICLIPYRTAQKNYEVANMSGMQLCLMADFNVLRKLNIKSIGRQVCPLFCPGAKISTNIFIFPIDKYELMCYN